MEFILEVKCESLEKKTVAIFHLESEIVVIFKHTIGFWQNES